MLLFVYGSLRKGFHHPAYAYISQHFDFISDAKVQGVLYDMGDYPAAVPADGGDNSTIEGEVYLINEPTPVFAVLDKYEGEAYTRKLEPVKLPDGREVLAWVYWYTNPVTGKTRITDNDYLKYREKKGGVY